MARWVRDASIEAHPTVCRPLRATRLVRDQRQREQPGCVAPACLVVCLICALFVKFTAVKDNEHQSVVDDTGATLATCQRCRQLAADVRCALDGRRASQMVALSDPHAGCSPAGDTASSPSSLPLVTSLLPTQLAEFGTRAAWQSTSSLLRRGYYVLCMA